MKRQSNATHKAGHGTVGMYAFGQSFHLGPIAPPAKMRIEDPQRERLSWTSLTGLPSVKRHVDAIQTRRRKPVNSVNHPAR